jgi:hypothetical protein
MSLAHQVVPSGTVEHVPVRLDYWICLDGEPSWIIAK